ncbi:LLM class flavin-dependent oxidoreductase [Rhodococcus artemisiae]|uniref:LLM class flavin-dependent oxidoreductase n=1 Tax=Rhodococcus artemisiae TaxID=714159 RepID=A0ABU7L9S6_9NOCA|nr:LLM class flavin-dependent oxidoreductase [Rhodococcus artemisiae]MEE2058285.1 LLM class flavin-dependent oxidoreductase [Rhodococcus artemisiae]
MSQSHPFHLGVALDGAGWHPASWREPNSLPQELFSGAYWTGLAAAAERGLLDFLTIEDTLAAPTDPYVAEDPDATDVVRARLDAHLVAARIAPQTQHLGLIPTITTTHTEPFNVSKALATLDYTSRGRAGWQVKVSPSQQEASHFGRRTIPGLNKTGREASANSEPPTFVRDLFDEAADVVEVVRRLWDSWEDGADIRDVETRRFIDRDKLHYVDFEGRFFSVRGPSITPRPPQGQPVVTALAHRDFAYELAARGADLVFVTPTETNGSRVLADVASAADRVEREGERLRVYADVLVFLDTDGELGADRLRRLDDAAGRELVSDATVFTGSAAELADRLEAWQQEGFDGFRLRPGVAVDDLRSITEALVPELQRRGLFRTEYPDTSLRGLLGLATDVPNRYATGTPAA